MKILVTGASGFVGRHLAPRLKQDEHELVSLGRRDLHASQPEVWSASVPVDFTEDFKVPDLGSFDAIVHLAGHAHARSSRASALRHEAINYRATEKLARAAVAAGIKRFLFISSIAVYGEPAGHVGRRASVWKESTELRPTTPYGRSKLAAERALIAATKGSQTSFTILRPTLIYGAHAPGNFGALIRFIEKGWPLPIGGFTNRRSFLSIQNLVDAIARALTAASAQNEVFNVADSDVVSTEQFVSWIAESMGRPTPVVKVSSPVRSAFLMVPLIGPRLGKLVATCEVDAQKIREILKWTPPFTTRSGVAHAVAPVASKV